MPKMRLLSMGQPASAPDAADVAGLMGPLGMAGQVGKLAPKARALSEGEEWGIKQLEDLLKRTFGEVGIVKGNGTGPALTKKELSRARSVMRRQPK